MPSNSAAWLVSAKARPLEVKSAPYPSAGEGQIVIKNRAVAINPVDYKIQEYAVFELEYPVILGHDVAGDVVEVGSSVQRFKKGDRVIGNTVGFTNKNQAECALQEFVVLRDNMTSPIPDSLSFERAVVIPLGLSTAAAGMFQKEFLALNHPSLSPKPAGRTLLVWGGSSSVGCNAIQLGVAAGYEVITTASKKNHDLVQKLGASQVFDYNSPNITEELVNALKDKTIAGAMDCISIDGAMAKCLDIVGKCQGNRFVATVLPVQDSLPEGVGAGRVHATNISNNEVGKAVYEDYLPQALEQGKFVAAPEPLVVGKGLESVQTGFDTLKEGVSAKKVVVTL